MKGKLIYKMSYDYFGDYNLAAIALMYENAVVNNAMERSDKQVSLFLVTEQNTGNARKIQIIQKLIL